MAILELLSSERPPCRWGKRCGREACQAGHLHALEWLRDHDFPWTLECCRYAASRGDLGLLKWMRAQDPPWPWDASVFRCAAGMQQVETLRWLLTQTPACPCTATDAAAYPAYILLVKPGMWGCWSASSCPSRTCHSSVIRPPFKDSWDSSWTCAAAAVMPLIESYL